MPAGFKKAARCVTPAALRSAASLSVKPDPNNIAQMKIEFRVEPNVPVKKDSTVKISSLSALGENFLLHCAGHAERLPWPKTATPFRPALTPASTTSKPPSATSARKPRN